MAELNTLLVDYGGVLTSPLAACMGAWCDADGVDPQAFAAVMRRWLTPGAAVNPVHQLETGHLDPAEFETALAGELRTRDGRRLEPSGLLGRMFAGFAVESEMTGLVAAAKRSGLHTGLVSNSWGNTYPREGWVALFDTVVISAEVGVRKPQPEIYLLAAQRLGVDPAQCVFVDDLGPNVRGALAVGMLGVHHVDPATTRAELAALFTDRF